MKLFQLLFQIFFYKNILNIIQNIASYLKYTSLFKISLFKIRIRRRDVSEYIESLTER